MNLFKTFSLPPLPFSKSQVFVGENVQALKTPNNNWQAKLHEIERLSVVPNSHKYQTCIRMILKVNWLVCQEKEVGGREKKKERKVDEIFLPACQRGTGSVPTAFVIRHARTHTHIHTHIKIY